MALAALLPLIQAIAPHLLRSGAAAGTAVSVTGGAAAAGLSGGLNSLIAQFTGSVQGFGSAAELGVQFRRRTTSPARSPTCKQPWVALVKSKLISPTALDTPIRRLAWRSTTQAAPSISSNWLIKFRFWISEDIDCNTWQSSIRDAVIAAKLATITGLPILVSFVCDGEGRILSGEQEAVATGVLLPMGGKALEVNCGPANTLAEPLAELRAICGPDFPLIAYGNIGYADEAKGWINTDAESPESYLHHAETWPVQILGGCCGTTPSHIRRLRVRRNDST